MSYIIADCNILSCVVLYYIVLCHHILTNLLHTYLLLLHSKELSGGYCYLYENDGSNCIFHKSIEFELDNLGIYGESPDTSKLSFDLNPGQKQFILLKEIDSTATNKMSMKTEFTITFK